MRPPRHIQYKGVAYVLAEAPPEDFDMDRVMDITKAMLRSSDYAKEKFDSTSPQQFEDELDAASTILVKAIFHDIVFSEPKGNYAKFFDWLAKEHPRSETAAPVYGIVKGLQKADPPLFQRIVRAVRPEALQMTAAVDNGRAFRLRPPVITLRFRGALYRLALQLPQKTEDDEELISRMVQKCVGKHMTYGPIAKVWCVYPPDGDTRQFVRRVHTEEQARQEAEALLFRQRYLGIPIEASTLRTAIIRKCRKSDKKKGKPSTWCLYSRHKVCRTKNGKKVCRRKLLGRHPSKQSALKQERAIQVRKHGSAPEQLMYKGARYRIVSAVAAPGNE